MGTALTARRVDRPSAWSAPLPTLRDTSRCRYNPRPERTRRVGLGLRLERGEPVVADRHGDFERLHQAAERQFPFEHGDRKQRDAGALHGRLRHDHRGIEHHALDWGTCDAGGGEPARPFVDTVGSQQVLRGEIFRPVDASRNDRRAHRRQRRRHQQRRIGAAPGAVAIADGEVEALAGEIDEVVVGLDAQIDKGVRVPE